MITRILRRTYSDNDLIFVRGGDLDRVHRVRPADLPQLLPDADGEREPASRSSSATSAGAGRSPTSTATSATCCARSTSGRAGRWTHLEPNHQIQVLSSAFYRNKAAYVVGKLVNGYDELPFVVPVLHDGRTACSSSTRSCSTRSSINILFSLSRAYFMVDMEVPSGYVEFLRSMMPLRARSELYTMLGLGKQGKTLFFRDLLQHLHHSRDAFVEAPGIRGQVMLVFTLPSYPYVFKVIRDVFGPGKDTDRATVALEVRDGQARRPGRPDGRHARVRRPRAPARALLGGAARAAATSWRPRWSRTATRS